MSFQKLKELLQLLGVQQLLAVPIYKGEELGGFLSIDDPKQYGEDATILKMIAECITTEFAKRILTRNIEELSLVDKLTGLGNRNQYLQYLAFSSHPHKHKGTGHLNYDLLPHSLSLIHLSLLKRLPLSLEEF